MKIQKLLPILFCFSVAFLNANTLPLPKLTFDFGIEKPVGCQYRIRIRYFGNANITVNVGGQTINRTYPAYPTSGGTDFVTITVPFGPTVATVNTTNCIVFITNAPGSAFYVFDYYPVVNAQLIFNENCTISD